MSEPSIDSLAIPAAGNTTYSRRIPLQDVRLRRELIHRRLAIALIRRVMRLLGLYLADAVLLAGVVFGIGMVWPHPFLVDLIPAVVLIFLLSLNAAGAYRPGEARSDWRRILAGVVVGALILVSIASMAPDVALQPVLILSAGVLGFGALVTWRLVSSEVVRQANARGLGLRRAVIVGNLSEVGIAIQQLREKGNTDQYIVGHLAPDEEPDPAALGTLRDLTMTLDELDVQEVVLATNLTEGRLRGVAEECFQRGTSLYVFPSVFSAAGCRVEPLFVGGCHLMHLTPARIEVPSLFIKRLFDVVIASAALLVCAPLVLLIAVAIKLDSRGPVFYRAKRVGLGGQLFDMWKFRSMSENAQEMEHELAHLNIYPNGTFKIAQDPRVTRVGRILRRTSMDELPQLLNVLGGTMSLVGPRPALPGDLERYEPHHFERLTVVPGITGPWQVGGRNLITDFETIIGMERNYIQGWSLLLDVEILLRTPGVVWRGEGAY